MLNITWLCCRAKSCPADTLRQLFQSLVLASDERMACACFGVLATLLGAAEPDEAALGICTGIPYGASAQPRSLSETRPPLCMRSILHTNAVHMHRCSMIALIK
jgi:hypothetical protein